MIEPTVHQIIMGTVSEETDRGLDETTAWKIVGRLTERGWVIVKAEDL